MLDVTVVGDVLIEHGHLAATDTCTDVAHAVIETNGGMLVVGIGITGLGGQPHNLVSILGRAADEGSATAGGDHLVAVEGEDSVLAKGAQHLTVEARTHTLGSVLDDRDAIAVGNGHDAVDMVGHAVERHGHDGLGVAAGTGLAVEDGLLEQFRVHIPGVLLGTNEHGLGATIGNGVRGGAEGEALHAHLVARAHATGEQRQMDGTGAGGEADNGAVEQPPLNLPLLGRSAPFP